MSIEGHVFPSWTLNEKNPKTDIIPLERRYSRLLLGDSGMKKGITSLPHAKEEAQRIGSLVVQALAHADKAAKLVAQVHESAEALQKYFDDLLPEAKTRAVKVSAPIVKLHPESGLLRAEKEADAPPTVAERVLVIMRDIHRPVLPKEIARHYLLRDWPLPKKGTIYNLISGTVAYLYQRKQVLRRTDKGYALLHDDIRELMNSPVIETEADKRHRAKYLAKKKAERAGVAEPTPPEQPSLSGMDDQEPVAL